MSEVSQLAALTAGNATLQRNLQLGDYILSRAEMLSEDDVEVCLYAFNKSGD
jgi:hypothetical protein